MISRKRPLAVLAAFLLTAPGALAQDGWVFAGPEAGQFQAFAGTCPLDDPATGNFLCFGLSCDAPGAAPALALMAAGTGLPDRFAMTISVDGTGFAPVEMRPVPMEGIAKWLAVGQGGAAFQALYAAIRAGGQARLAFQDHLADPVTVDLAGAGPALDQLAQVCGG